MKKIFTICAAAAMVAACAKETPVTPETVVTPVENGEAVAVLFDSNVTASVETKAQGGVDAWNQAQTIYVYGFQRQAGGINYATATPFINNVAAISPAEGAAGNAIDVLDASGKPFYYLGNNTFDFYGYYVDDLAIEPVANADGIYLDLTLTGGEDIMIAKADPATDVQKAKDAGLFKGDASWNDAYAYSAYAARRGVQPSLTFKHQLARFTFQITSGANYDSEDEAKLYVKGLTMAARNKAQLCVAGSNLGLTSIQNDLADLSLRSLVNGQLTDLQVYEVPDNDVVVEEGANVIGESLMVIPGNDVYSINLIMEQDGNEVPCPIDLKFSSVTGAPAGQTQFTAGYSYRVTIKVYDLENVELTAELEPWLPGGDIEINTDDAPEIF